MARANTVTYNGIYHCNHCKAYVIIRSQKRFEEFNNNECPVCGSSDLSSITDGTIIFWKPKKRKK